MIKREAITSVLAVVLFTVVLGLLYPLAMTGIGQLAFPGAANGAKVEQGGRVVGSKLIAQPFVKPVLDASGEPATDDEGEPIVESDPRYFQPRPSQTGYNPSGTFFNNAGPNNLDTRDLIAANVKAYLDLEGPHNPNLTAVKVPVDAAMNSASGVDPHISPANAAVQARRIAAVRELPPARVAALISAHTQGRFLGLIGESGVNVLTLNIALDALDKEPAA